MTFFMVCALRNDGVYPFPSFSLFLYYNLYYNLISYSILLYLTTVKLSSTIFISISKSHSEHPPSPNRRVLLLRNVVNFLDFEDSNQKIIDFYEAIENLCNFANSIKFLVQHGTCF